MPSFLDLSPESKLRLCGFLDLPTELQERLIAHVGEFVPYPQVLLKRLTEHGGVVGGEVALAFLLRHTDFTAESLDLYVPVDEQSWMRFQNHLIYDQWAIPESGYPTLSTRPRSRLARKPTPGRGIRTATRFTSTRFASSVASLERTVNLFRSQSSDPLVPISQARATHLLAYANLDHYGCGYPALLLSSRSLMGTGPADENELIIRDMAKGIDFRLSPTQWGDIPLAACGSQQWLCPSQTRTFDDSGCMYARMRPMKSDPLETRVMWRMVCRPCVGGCLAGGGSAEWLEFLHDETLLQM